MTLFLDTEYNGTDGELMSLALVSDMADDVCYFVLPYPIRINTWVMENVVPKLFVLWPTYQGASTQFMDLHTAQMKLQTYLGHHKDEKIIADWPEDFIYMLKMLYGVNGQRVALELDMCLIKTGDTPEEEPQSKIPHNALADAFALMEWSKNK